MAHISENSYRLKIKKTEDRLPEIIHGKIAPEPAVWVFILPYDPSNPFLEESNKWAASILNFANNCHEKSLFCIMATPATAASLWSVMEHSLHYHLWVTIKLSNVIEEKGALANQHAALLILSKDKGALRHTKTRISYTYCPYCDRTSKDYGGKKHTYHEYGTLISDIWRDITCNPAEYPSDVITRLSDLFGLRSFKTLYTIDFRNTAASNRVFPIPSNNLDIERNEIPRLTKRQELLLGDSLEVMKTLPSESIDFCFADPPYNLKKKYDSWDDALEIREYFLWCDKWLNELARVLKPGRTLAVLNIPQWAIRHFSYLSILLNFQNWIVWEGLSLPVRMIMPANYSIVCFSKGTPRDLPGKRQNIESADKRELESIQESYCIRSICVRERFLAGVCDKVPITDLWWDIHRLKHNSRRADHPCQLPPALMRRLIAMFTYPKECVLDPFNGVGTTTLAAEELDRSFVGIELSEKYHNITKQRHEEIRKGLDPFRKRNCVPTAKNNYVPRLKKQKYAVPKKELQLEIKRIASELGRIPTREEVASISKYPKAYFDDYFISWGEACAAARTTGMSEIRALKSKGQIDIQLSLFKR
jgi:site-specific DNA-methyltransferase (adenine-specific)